MSDEIQGLIQIAIQVPALGILGLIFYLVFKVIFDRLLPKIDGLIIAVSSFTTVLTEHSGLIREQNGLLRDCSTKIDMLITAQTRRGLE